MKNKKSNLALTSKKLCHGPMSKTKDERNSELLAMYMISPRH